MTLPDAWKILGVEPGATKGEVKKAFRQKIRQSHPDVVGDDGSLLQRVRDAFALVDSVENPAMWDQAVSEEGLPAWASGLLQGVQWTADCPSYAAFLQKPGAKALAVGEIDFKTGIRPWAAAWGKYSQQDANVEAMRVCRQYGGKCRLIFVGSGNARARTPVKPFAGEDERQWWNEQFQGAGTTPGFGWMPVVDSDKEKFIGYKNVPAGDRFGVESRIRVPVFKHKDGGMPYYYSPLRPKERIYMKKASFQRSKPLAGKGFKYDPRLAEIQQLGQLHGRW